MNTPQFIFPQWPCPKNVKAIITTRQGGCSQPPWDGFNLALHVDDNKKHVEQNRALLQPQVPDSILWLEQVHSNRVVCSDDGSLSPAEGSSHNAEGSLPCAEGSIPCADGSYSTKQNQVCAVLTADCLPVLMCNHQGSAVASVHAGWRGLANGIVEQGVKKIIAASNCSPEDILVYLGPAIGPVAFEVGLEVKEAFCEAMPSESAFSPVSGKSDKLLANLYQLARLRLNALGVTAIFGGNYCTYTDAKRFYSYRRDGQTGRMASLIWLKN